MVRLPLAALADVQAQLRHLLLDAAKHKLAVLADQLARELLHALQEAQLRRRCRARRAAEGKLHAVAGGGCEKRSTRSRTHSTSWMIVLRYLVLSTPKVWANLLASSFTANVFLRLASCDCVV